MSYLENESIPLLAPPETDSLIVYGNNNIANYCYILKILKEKSKTNLKYSRRIAINYNSDDILFNISDIHVEVDFDLLGVGEYNIFLQLFNQVKDNIAPNKPEFYIVCINFQNIKSELMSIFYSFFALKVKFIFSTTKLSFICNNVLKRSLIKKVKGTFKNDHMSFESNVGKLASFIINEKPTNSLFIMRELLYKLLILNLDIHDCFERLFVILIDNGYLTFATINHAIKEYTQFILKYNNNYRPIYHIESYIVSLINLKNS